jgi:O-antigen/teichoic acid export membrane protein
MKKNNLINKFLSFSIGSWFTLFIGFFTTPLITRLIDPGDYGRYSMFNLVTNITMIIMVMALDQSFVRFFYEEDEKGRTKLLYYCLLGPLIASIIVSLIAICLWRPLSSLLYENASFNSILLTIICSIIMIINRYATLVIRMKQRGKLYSLIQIIQKVVYLGSVLSLYMLSVSGFSILAVSITIAYVVATVIAVYIERHFWYAKDTKNVKLKNNLRDIWKFGAPLTITFLVTWLFQSADRIAIKYWGSYEELGIYASAFSIISLLNVVQNSFTTFWTPVALERYEKNKEDSYFFERMSIIISIAMFVLAVGIILFRDLIVILLGQKYREAALIMPFLTLMPIMYTISETTVVGISFKKKSSYNFWISIIACMVNIIGNGILVPRIGAKGAAISTGLSYIVFYYIRTIASARLYKVNYHVLKASIVIACLSIFAMYATFNSFNLIYLVMGIICLGVILICYKNEIVREIRKKI